MLHISVPDSKFATPIAGKTTIRQWSLEFLRPYIRQHHFWDDEQISAGIDAYIDFIGQFVGQPSLTTDVPSEHIDTVWHAHILHTRNYQAFCTQCLGFFLHHTPYSDRANCGGDGGGGGCGGGGGD